MPQRAAFGVGSDDYLNALSPGMVRSPSAASIDSKKRKRTKDTKYYGVKAGHTVGVFTSWPDCQDAITGFKGANCKSRSGNGVVRQPSVVSIRHHLAVLTCLYPSL